MHVILKGGMPFGEIYLLFKPYVKHYFTNTFQLIYIIILLENQCLHVSLKNCDFGLVKKNIFHINGDGIESTIYW